MAAKKSALREKISNNKVRYAIATGRVSLLPARSRVVDTNEGPKVVQEPGLSLEAVGVQRPGGGGSAREAGMTREFDPANPSDAELIRRIDEFIEMYPEIAGSPKIQLVKLQGEGSLIPHGRWNELGVADLETLINLNGLSLEACMQYEISRGDQTRREVVKLLEDLYEKRLEETIDASTQKVAL